jgi:general secretion pathway protein A
MYCNLFGFSEKPFNITPDPKFLYLTRDHREILTSLIYGIRERRGFIVVTGDVGTGKTTLLNAMLERLNHDTKVAFIFNTDLTFKQMLIMALFDLGLARQKERITKLQAIQRLNDFAVRQFSSGGNVALIIDEAQNLPPRTLESLRLLSNLETDKHKLIQIVLCGQLELDDKLHLPELRQLIQRIAFRRYTAPLGETDTYKYIEHRLNIANYEGSSLFSRNARKLIWGYSKGVPRQINILCDNSLLIGYGLGKKKIWEGIVAEAIEDLTFSPLKQDHGQDHGQNVALPDTAPGRGFKAKFFRIRFALMTGLLIIGCFILATWFFIRNASPDLSGIKSSICQYICQ